MRRILTIGNRQTLGVGEALPLNAILAPCASNLPLLEQFAQTDYDIAETTWRSHGHRITL